MRRAVSTASRCVDGRGSWGDRLDARRGRRRRRGRGAEAARSGEREENARSVFACVDVGNVGEHAFHSRELERACAVVRTRCFYEIENERRGETLTFSFDDADEADEADEDDSNATRASKPRLRWWEDRIASETARETMFQRVGMRGVRTFAAATRADADGTPLDADVVASNATTRENPIDVTALRRWSVVRARTDTEDDANLFVVAGTLDVHLGASLPGEDLVGARPSPSDDDDGTETDAFDPIDALTNPRRAYVFNVCVAPEFRGLGVAERLLARAPTFARRHRRRRRVRPRRDRQSRRASRLRKGILRRRTRTILRRRRRASSALVPTRPPRRRRRAAKLLKKMNHSRIHSRQCPARRTRDERAKSRRTRAGDDGDDVRRPHRRRGRGRARVSA